MGKVFTFYILIIHNFVNYVMSLDGRIINFVNWGCLNSSFDFRLYLEWL